MAEDQFLVLFWWHPCLSIQMVQGKTSTNELIKMTGETPEVRINKKLPRFEKSTIEKSLSGANPASRTPIEEVKKRKIIKI